MATIVTMVTIVTVMLFGDATRRVIAIGGSWFVVQSKLALEYSFIKQIKKDRKEKERKEKGSISVCLILSRHFQSSYFLG